MVHAMQGWGSSLPHARALSAVAEPQQQPKQEVRAAFGCWGVAEGVQRIGTYGQGPRTPRLSRVERLSLLAQLGVLFWVGIVLSRHYAAALVPRAFAR